jgi:hypothetical protein
MKTLTPITQRNKPPISRSQNCWLIKKSEIKVRPKPAIHPKSTSAVANPRAETKPERRPSNNVRRIHRMPIGPTGTAMDKPTTTPFKKRMTVIEEDS